MPMVEAADLILCAGYDPIEMRTGWRDPWDPATARVTIGPREATLGRRLCAGRANWHADVPEAFDATVQVRYNHRGAPGRVRITII